METEWATALKAIAPMKVSISIDPIYSNNSMRPDSFMVEDQFPGSNAIGDAQNGSKAGAAKGTGKVSQKTSTENGITKGEYKNLRKKTPNNEIRKMVNPDGSKVDPGYGYEVDKFEADHIVSTKEITEIDGFSRLTKEQQIEILNLKDNFVGLGKSTYASKGAYWWADWKGHSKMGDVPVNVRMQMLELVEQARDALKVAIEARLK